MSVPRFSALRRDGQPCGALAASPDAIFCRHHEQLADVHGEDAVREGRYPRSRNPLAETADRGRDRDERAQRQHREPRRRASGARTGRRRRPWTRSSRRCSTPRSEPRGSTGPPSPAPTAARSTAPRSTSPTSAPASPPSSFSSARASAAPPRPRSPTTPRSPPHPRQSSRCRGKTSRRCSLLSSPTRSNRSSQVRPAPSSASASPVLAPRAAGFCARRWTKSRWLR